MTNLLKSNYCWVSIQQNGEWSTLVYMCGCIKKDPDSESEPPRHNDCSGYLQPAETHLVLHSGNCPDINNSYSIKLS